LIIKLGEPHYRRTESSWHEAGAPTARVELRRTKAGLSCQVDVTKSDICFAPARDANPLDNEHPDTNSDGVQVYLRVPDHFHAAWILVGERDGSLRVTSRTVDRSPAPDVQGEWSPRADGYTMRFDIACHLPDDFDLQLVVNETTSDRERRRGQLVLTGTEPGGEWAYLRGDRESVDAFLHIVQAD
jgi:hypothetical protein